jgi:hypothetical protein
VSALALRALSALAAGPERREVRLVAAAIRECGDAETLSLFGLPQEGPGPVFDRVALARVEELAEEAGASSLTALDLYAYVVAGPDWSPFPHVRAADAEAEEGED